MKSGMFSLFLMPQTYKMPWDSWIKSTKSFLFCFHGGLLWRRLLMLVATAMESSIPIYYWVNECVVSRYPGKSFLHNELVKLFAIWGFWRCLWSWLYWSLCGHITEYLPGVFGSSDWAGCFAESFWKENWSQKSEHKFEHLGWWQKGTNQIFMESRPTGPRKQFANIEEMSGKREVTWFIQLQNHLWKIT